MDIEHLVNDAGIRILVLETPEDFHDMLRGTLREIPRFGGDQVPFLHAMRMWTEAGRTPLTAEQNAVQIFSHQLVHALEDDSLDLELQQHLAHVYSCTSFFCAWPVGGKDKTEGVLSVPRRASGEQIRIARDTLTEALQLAGHWDIPRPPASAFESKAPRFADRMTTLEWVRWVLVVRLQQILDGTFAMPSGSQLCSLCIDLAVDPQNGNLMRALGQLDDHFVSRIHG